MLRVLFELSKIMKIVEKIPKRVRRMSSLFPKALPISQKAKEWQERLFLEMTIRYSKIRTHPIQVALIVFLVLYVGSMSMLLMFTRSEEFWGAIFLTTSAAFGDIETGLGEKPPLEGSLIAIFCLILNVIFLGVVLAYLNDYVGKLSSEGGYIKKKVNYKGHIVICGWNYQGEHIIDALRSKDIHSKKQIVVLTDHKKRPFKRADVVFVRGSPLEPNDLKRAGVAKAESVIILTDVPIEKSCNPDDNAFVTSTLIRSYINKNAYISVQLLSSKNKKHLTIAGVNTIVCLDELGGSILAFSAEYHGILKIIRELLFTGKGSEIHRCEKIPGEYLHKSFTEFGKELLDKKMILIAIETIDDDHVRKVCSKDYIQKFTDPKSGDKKVLIVNPQGDYKLRKDDTLFIISEKKPTEKESTILNDHIVICGWNYQGNDIIRTLKKIHKKQITVFADCEKYKKNPFEERDDVVFVPGSPLEMKEENVEKAGLDKAGSVIILTDIHSPIEKSYNPDDRAFVISTLIRRDINRTAHISVQLLSSKNKKRLNIAGANTIVCLDKLGGSILAYSAEYHGILKIIQELLITPKGSEIYRCKQKIPDKYLCKNFREVGKQLLDKKMILVAIETEDDGPVRKVCSEDYIHDFIDPKSGYEKALIVNPQGDYELREDDSLFIISESEPTEL